MGKWAAAEPGGAPRNTSRMELRPKIRLFRGFRAFAPSRPPTTTTATIPNTPRFGGFETPVIGCWAEYGSDGQGKWEKGTAATPGGTPRGHGKWEGRHNGPPRNMAEPHGA